MTIKDCEHKWATNPAGEIYCINCFVGPLYSYLNKNNFSDMFAKYQKNHNLSDSQFAKIIGTSRQNLKYIKEGQVPSLSIGLKFMDFFNISVDEMVGKEKKD